MLNFSYFLSLRAEWLEKFRVQNMNKGKRGKSKMFVQRKSNIVAPTHLNLQGGTYCVPRDEENDFLRKYILILYLVKEGAGWH